MTQLSNFRELGGIPTPHGMVKKGMIFRGGPLSNLSDDDRKYITEVLKIETIFDLRSSNEIIRSPEDRFDGIRYIHLDIMKSVYEESADPNEFMKITTVQILHMYMQKLYRDIVLNETSQAMYGLLLKEMAENGKRVYFHCTAGKDRTGIAAMLILSALGTDRVKIYEDYLKTNDNVSQIFKKVAEGFGEEDAKTANSSLGEAMLGVDKSYLDAAFDAIESKYKSVDRYLEHKLGITPGLRDQLIKHYVAA